MAEVIHIDNESNQNIWDVISADRIPKKNCKQDWEQDSFKLHVPDNYKPKSAEIIDKTGGFPHLIFCYQLWLSPSP